MENEQQMQLNSLKILIDGIKLAQKRGAFTLEESAKIWNAVKTFIDDNTNNINELETNNQ